MPAPSDGDEEEELLRERILGTESHIHLKTWYPRLKQALAELQKLNAELEERIAQRGAELEESHARLLVAERLATTGRMMAVVAHELNTPLGALASSTSSMAGDAGRAIGMALDLATAEGGGGLDREGSAFLRILVELGLAEAGECERMPADFAERKALKARLEEAGCPADDSEAAVEALDELGLGTALDGETLALAARHPRLVGAAAVLCAPARSAAIARAAALKASEALRRLIETGRGSFDDAVFSPSHKDPIL